MTFSTKDMTEILVAGGQDKMFKIDIAKGSITQTVCSSPPSNEHLILTHSQVPTDASYRYTIMKRGAQLICAATSTGFIHVIEPTTCTVTRIWKAHAGWINDMDIRSDILVTCGWSQRQQQGFALDHLANVFDLKTLMPLPPLPFPPGAAYVRMHPKMSTTCIVASQTGLMYAVDIMNPDTPAMKHANMLDTHMLGLDLAPSGEALALTDAQCSIHLWGSPSKIQFADFPISTDFVDTPAPVTTLDFSPDPYVSQRRTSR